jgi:alkanesulfonate monooxygenase SsuD/methylene tetrahydromethanopterin reductase-like flavin-dependent oxidoreductase (luciferase family)
MPAGGRIPIEIAAKGARMLGVVARHADVWNANLPPIPARFARAEAHLEAACESCGRDPKAIARSMWLFTRVQDKSEPQAALEEFRRLNPWFGDVPDAEIAPALVVGGAAHCRERLAALAREFGLDLPVIDLSGMDATAARRTLEAIPAGEQLR